MSSWDVTRVKATFRLATQRLGQLRDRMDAQAPVTGRDISILLQQGSTTLARAKAQKLIRDDIMGNLLELLEMQIGVLVERIEEIEGGSPSPTVIEAASSIIYAAPQVEAKDLVIVRDLLVQRLGPAFLHSAITNKDNYVSPKVVRALSAPPASAAELDTYLMGIAKAYRVEWQPELQPDDVLHALAEILDAESSPTVDMPLLRRLCAHGIPSTPPWLRPRIWRLLLGTLPVLKITWDVEAKKQRDSYYDLINRLLMPFSSLPPPTTPLASLDAQLTNAIKDLFRVPPNLLTALEEEPESSSLSPLDPSAPEEIRIACATNLDARLEAIHARDASVSQDPPEIRLEGDSYAIPEISLQSPDAEADADADESSTRPSKNQRTLFSSKMFNTGGAHPKHASALIRLLYIHSCLNPANHSPHMASLLIPLYAVLNEEVEPQDQAHIEADTFWLFEAMVSEFSELEDQDGGNRWMKKFGERVAWADPELSSDLQVKGLDPSLPHYSYRWLAPLLTHTLPLPSVLSIWDALFSRAMTERNSCPKLEYLLDVCTSMLLRSKGPLLRLGKSGPRSPSLWNDESGSMPPPSPVRAWELNDAFIEGMALLQMYPIEAAGGVESILQTAAELAARREQQLRAPKADNSTLGSRLATSMWRGFTNQASSPASSPESSDDEDTAMENTDTESSRRAPTSPKPTGLTASWSNTIWKGITNQSAMEAPPSPLSPASPLSPLPPSPVLPTPSPQPDLLTPSAPSTSSLWNYAEKFKETDAAATLAKVSTNWRVKALEAWSSRGAAGPPPPASAASSMAALSHPRSGSYSAGLPPKAEDNDRRSSLPHMDRSQVYSPPARPAYFRPPRDSMMPQPRRSPLSSPTSPDPEMSPDDSGHNPAKLIRESIASFAGFTHAPAPKPAPKAGPRPLLLSSSSLLTGTPTPPVSRSTNVTPAIGGHRRDWSDVMQNKPHLTHKASVSSISSTSEAPGRHLRADNRSSDWESDATESRKVRINRGSVSPMAPMFRTGRPASDRSSSGPAENGINPLRSWGRVDAPDSPVTLPSSPPPPTPESSRFPGNNVQVSGSDSQRGSMVLSESNVRVLDAPATSRKITRKRSPPPSAAAVEGETSDSSAAPAPVMAPSRSPRTRSKRYVNRPTNLTIHRHDSNASATSDVKTPSPNSLQLPADGAEDPDTGMTPRALTFDENQSSSPSPPSPRSPKMVRKLSGEGRARKTSTDGQPPRTRKVSTDGRVVRPRKISTGSKEVKRESRGEEGDDEGYDDLLSAYSESEGNGTDTKLR